MKIDSLLTVFVSVGGYLNGSLDFFFESMTLPSLQTCRTSSSRYMNTWNSILQSNYEPHLQLSLWLDSAQFFRSALGMSELTLTLFYNFRLAFPPSNY